ncbi:putative Guanine nucleotide-binding protein subunit beta-like protein A [Monocercomonoides exilis]|uniref:putative Guanine nucleotide-binding protein subunit beta-like protein A n=1 Tax=Monocercomonoides exilis TaxID=2049356 RepID=UPI00355A3584|nr:putative Guanine nucleotide-binding protein subunit beta-like protein A [Monocercomonoides exilis]KAH7830350.1 putative Guanine nucleotide-binding protein subunit beta-like protein A [Monocercomonoides exilis]|eukprot:MONOS_16783.1-p1 / transcript=MONOS_16783.1 / gene=MONOS_16783 / organism=Monocercomonoides_exilis_PA203 / gene_product=Guanine nucleotide-binding protein subunit beta-like protein A / transcript_product=Guanine nucleotide-binding protein subunit beta-like protein A / location=Mono_scaffold00007:274777-275877(-) / protein_length=326 / sequence_SO=supercontig / SO=protein_coding / is_pseudo=false
MASQGSGVVSRGSYKNHGDWVTSIAAAGDHIVSGSRDKTLCMWKINETHPESYITPKSVLTGHNHFVQDICLSSDGQYALSASWDKTLRLWDLSAKKTIARFNGHTDDVLSVALSRGNRQIISAGRDKTIKLWNIHGELKYSTAELPEWITCVRFGMADDLNPIVSAGYDRMIRVWDRTTFAQKYALTGHTGYINSIAISPDSAFVASGGKDQVVNLYDLNTGSHLYTLQAGDVINSITFSPSKLWIAVGTDSALKIFCLKKKQCIIDLKLQAADREVAVDAEAETKEPKVPKCLSTSFSIDGMNLFAGYSDGFIRSWNIPATTQ